MRRFLFIFLGLFVLKASAQNNPPTLQCVSVAAVSGNISLSWVAPVPATGLLGYNIYRASLMAGPYTLIQNVVPGNSTYSDGGINGNAQKYYYYMVAQYVGGQTSVPTDTLQSILMTVGTTASTKAVALLAWNPLHQPTLPQHANGKYYIYKQIHAKIFFVDSTVSTFYNDTNKAVCDTPKVTYHVLFIVKNGAVKDTCSSSYQQQKFHDDIPSTMPVIERITVDTISGKAIICWHPVKDPDVMGYTVVKDPSFNQPPREDNVLIPDTCVSITNSNPAAGAEVYSVFAYDSCGNPGLYNASGHTTIYLRSALDFCAGRISVSWSAYKGWTTGVRNYLLYVSMNGGPFHVLDSVGPNTFNYTHTGLVPLMQYQYYIKAQQSGVSVISISNKSPVVTFRAALAPAYIHITSLNALGGSDSVIVSFAVDTSGRPKLYEVFSAVDGKQFNEIGTINNTVGQPGFIYRDNKASPSVRPYYYKVIAIDSCGQPMQVSDTVRTILAGARFNDSLVNIISWNSYTGWGGNVAQYNIYESVNDTGGHILLTGVSGNTFLYKHDITNNIEADGLFYQAGKGVEANGIFYYYIEAVEAGGNGNKSYSNRTSTVQPPRLFVPDAFLPGSLNPVNQIFRPVSDFVGASQYSFTIYSRWGTKVFQTTLPNDGWDGTYYGKPCPVDIYKYRIAFTATNGFHFEKTGSVALIR